MSGVDRMDTVVGVDRVDTDIRGGQDGSRQQGWTGQLQMSGVDRMGTGSRDGQDG